jgi:ABC-type glycerol-3-phosphate transport system permease component
VAAGAAFGAGFAATGTFDETFTPALGAAAVLVFVTVWNEFLIGYALVLGDEHRLIQVGVYYFVTDTGIEWGPLMAGMVISVLPVVVLFASLQKFFIQGLTGGAVKG